MFLLNLSIGEFLALFGVLSGLIAALYLLDRSKHKKVVSTLRFWTPAQTAQEQQSRKRMREPWSLLLQLAALILLLLAIAQLQWGTRERRGRDHVLLLDTSAWAAQQQANGNGSVLDGEKAIARQFVHGLPGVDRVMLVRADSLATPVASFTNDHRQLRAGIDESASGFSALNLEQALSFARQAQSWSGGRTGEIVYLGPHLSGDNPADLPAISNLRTIAVEPVRENAGILRMSVRRSEDDSNAWHATVTLKNYGEAPRVVRLETRFGNTAFAPRRLVLVAGQETSAEYNFTTSAAGELSTHIEPHDTLPADDDAQVRLPKPGELRLAVFTLRPDVLRPLFEANHQVSAHFYPPSEYTLKPNADAVLLDQLAPAAPPILPSIWILPPRGASPLPIKSVLTDAVIKNWHSETLLGAGLHAKETQLPTVEVFETFEGDSVIANSAEGPVVVARPREQGHAQTAVIGFDPLAGEMRFEVTTPLLIANLLRWLSPDNLRSSDFSAGRVGAATVVLDAKEDAAHISITDNKGFAVPFTLRNRNLQLFASRPSVVRIISDARERVLSLTLPDLAEYRWKPAAAVASGLPAARNLAPSAVDLWKWLALAAAVCLIAEWFLYGRKRRLKVRYLALSLKLAALCAILIALLQPHLSMPGTKTGAVVLVDTSKSITEEDLARASALVSDMTRHQGGNWLKIVPFASRTRALSPIEISRGVHLVPASSDMGDATNFEVAIADSISAIPSGYLPRLVLISDGNENQGSSARAVAELERLHVPVDTIPLSGRPVTGLRLESLAMPRTAYAGEQIPIDLTINSPSAAQATVDLSAEGKPLGSQPIELVAGSNTVRVHARVKSNGATSISGRISAPRLGEAPFEQAIQLRRAKVLFISQDPPASEINLLKAFDEANFELTRDVPLLAKDLAGVQLVILNNLNLNDLSDSDKTHLEAYVRNGGGLLLIGGERQVYKDDKRFDALDQTLPAQLAPPKTPEGTCVALIIDKSSSMEGRKIDLARISAIGVVDHLRPIDTIGVLIFDNSFQWAVPMRRAEDKSIIKRLISGITPDGGTQIAPALAEAYRKVLVSKSTYKHIVLLTDGISEEGDSLELAKQAADHEVTISTVGLGQDVNRTYLEKVANTSGGRSYFLNEPQGLEQILLKDVQDYSGTTAVERVLAPIVERKAEVLDGVGIETAPALKGYARYKAKPSAETILDIDPEKKDPLYVRWQYGLGRAAVFASDAKSRWAEAWMTWPGFDKFWINITRDLLTHADPAEAAAQFDSANSDLIVNYRLAEDIPEPEKIPPIFVIGPGNFEKPIQVQRTAARRYQGRLHIGQATGLFRIRPVIESRAFPEIGLFRQHEELQDYGSNEALLTQISNLTGGRFNPPAASIFDPGGRAIYRVWQLWPAFLALAIALTIAELVARKWSGLLARFQ